MNRNDLHYTPAWLADRLAEVVPDGAKYVVDLAAGGGALLEAVERRGYPVRLAAADVDPGAVSSLRRDHPNWVVSQVNSLNATSYRSSAAFRLRARAYDAAVLNPPFSFRGGARVAVRYRGDEFRVAPATAFIAHALSWVRRAGVIVALVPTNVMNVRGDHDLWSQWRRTFAIETMEKLDRYTFPGARTTTMVVRLDLEASPLADLDRQREARFHGNRFSRSDRQLAGRCRCVDIVRGRVPVHRANGLYTESGVPFVHSTHVRDRSLSELTRRLPEELSSAGPFVLLPRVGTPTPQKVAVTKIGSLVLSDCLFGLRPVEPATVRALEELVHSEFSVLASQYIGSCARYITVERLTNWLRSYGYSVRHVRADEASTCRCIAEASDALA